MFDASVVGFTDIVGLTVLNMPMWIYRTTPLVTILATIWMFLSLARSSELAGDPCFWPLGNADVDFTSGHSVPLGGGGAGDRQPNCSCHTEEI